MEVSGEVADLMVKEGLEAAKIATELSAKGLVHVAALLAAMVKQNYKVVGKVGIERLMKESNAESVIIPIKAADYEQFQKIAKQFGVLYAAAKHENKETGVLHIISNVNYSQRELQRPAQRCYGGDGLSFAGSEAGGTGCKKSESPRSTREILRRARDWLESTAEG